MLVVPKVPGVLKVLVLKVLKVLVLKVLKVLVLKVLEVLKVLVLEVRAGGARDAAVMMPTSRPLDLVDSTSWTSRLRGLGGLT